MIDSPGHIDFSGEVSAASRLADGAFLLVDVVEGICSQTRSVLRQALREKVTPVLVLNKIDRLILELKKSPLDIYFHLSQLIHKLNGLVHGLRCELDPLNQDDSEFFAPNLKRNVIFASASDGWAFRPHQFSKLFAKKLGFNDDLALKDSLWGDHFLDPKTKVCCGLVANSHSLILSS